MHNDSRRTSHHVRKVPKSGNGLFGSTCIARSVRWWAIAAAQCAVERGCIGNARLQSGWRRLGRPPFDGASVTADRAILVRLAIVVLPLRTAVNSFCAILLRNVWSPPCGNDLHASSRTTSRFAAVRSSRCFIPLSPRSPALENIPIAEQREIRRVPGHGLRA